MSTIVTRSGKGAALTHVEVDANFTNLNTDKADKASPTFTGTTTAANLEYTGTLTGGTGVVAIGTNQIYKDASGNVGIGTSPSWKFQVKGTTSSFLINPDQAADGQIPASVRMASTLGKLSITADIQGTAGNGVTMAYFNGSSWASALEFGNVASGYSDILIGKSGGNVGIGTSSSGSPGSKLHVAGDLNGYICVERGIYPPGMLMRRANGSVTSPTQVLSGDLLAVFSAQGYTNASAYSPTIARIAVTAAENFTNTGNGAHLSFETTSIGTATFTERMRIDSSGNLLVGATGFPSSSSKMLVSGDLNATYANGVIQGQSKTAGDVSYPALYLSKFDNNSTTSQVLVRFAIGNYVAGQGQINGNGVNAAAFGTFSDSRLKENIIDLPSQLDNILALRPVEYDYIESEGGGHQIGFIAQEVQEIYPDLVGEREDGMFTLSDMNKNDARLIKAIQELKAIIDTQQEQINSLLGK